MDNYNFWILILTCLSFGEIRSQKCSISPKILYYEDKVLAIEFETKGCGKIETFQTLSSLTTQALDQYLVLNLTEHTKEFNFSTTFIKGISYQTHHFRGLKTEDDKLQIFYDNKNLTINKSNKKGGCKIKDWNAKPYNQRVKLTLEYHDTKSCKLLQGMKGNKNIFSKNVGVFKIKKNLRISETFIITKTKCGKHSKKTCSIKKSIVCESDIKNQEQICRYISFNAQLLGNDLNLTLILENCQCEYKLKWDNQTIMTNVKSAIIPLKNYMNIEISQHINGKPVLIQKFIYIPKNPNFHYNKIKGRLCTNTGWQRCILFDETNELNKYGKVLYPEPGRAPKRKH